MRSRTAHHVTAGMTVVALVLSGLWFVALAHDNAGKESASERYMKKVGVADGLFFVAPDMDSRDAYRALRDERLVRSTLLLRIVRALQGHTGAIQPGAYSLGDAETLRALSRALAEPKALWIDIPEGLSKRELAIHLASVTEWDDLEQHRFVTALAGIQWDTFNAKVIPLMEGLQGWNESEKVAFSGLAAFLSDGEFDILERVYVPGTYLVPRRASNGVVAGMLVEAVVDERDDLLPFFEEVLIAEQERREAIDNLVTGAIELLPDLVPLPPSDVFVEVRGEIPHLVFTTTYWNRGPGNLELVADPATAHVQGDIDRDVFQRIYRIDGDYRDHLVGTFRWHQEHQHYHFDDFVDYILEPAGDDPDHLRIEPRIQDKVTYCVRDVDPVTLSGITGGGNPVYRICGRNLQGISVGWGDSYYYSYAGQIISLYALPSGLYRLTYHVNPRGMLQEADLTNNRVSAILEYDADRRTVRVVSGGLNEQDNPRP